MRIKLLILIIVGFAGIATFGVLNSNNTVVVDNKSFGVLNSVESFAGGFNGFRECDDRVQNICA